MEDAHRTVAQLNSLIEANDFAGLQRKAHYLKGSSMVVGALEITKLCAQIENRAAAQQPVRLIVQELSRCLSVTSISPDCISEEVEQ